MVITILASGTEIELMFEGERIRVDEVIDKLVSDDIIDLWNRYEYLSPTPYTYGRLGELNESNAIVLDDRNKLREELKAHIMVSKMNRYHILSFTDFVYNEDHLYCICTL